MSYVMDTWSVWMSVLSDLLPAFRSRPLNVPLDLGLLGFGNTLQECGVVLDSKQNSLLDQPLRKTWRERKKKRC